MVLFNHSTRELTAKIVFYGPGLCGKTTNLKVLHEKLEKGMAGRLLSLSTAQDRTIYFDLLPVELGNIKGYTVRFQLATVPGQVFYNETRKLVLRGVDGVVFVVDSQWSMLSHNLESFHNLKENLKEAGLSLEALPLVIQYNKRDLPGVLGLDALQTSLGFADYPYVEAVASDGRGVVETFKLISKLTFVDLLRRLQKPGGLEPESLPFPNFGEGESTFTRPPGPKRTSFKEEAPQPIDVPPSIAPPPRAAFPTAAVHASPLTPFSPLTLADETEPEEETNDEKLPGMSMPTLEMPFESAAEALPTSGGDVFGDTMSRKGPLLASAVSVAALGPVVEPGKAEEPPSDAVPWVAPVLVDEPAPPPPPPPPPTPLLPAVDLSPLENAVAALASAREEEAARGETLRTELAEARELVATLMARTEALEALVAAKPDPEPIESRTSLERRLGDLERRPGFDAAIASVRQRLDSLEESASSSSGTERVDELAATVEALRQDMQRGQEHFAERLDPALMSVAGLRTALEDARLREERERSSLKAGLSLETVALGAAIEDTRRSIASLPEALSALREESSRNMDGLRSAVDEGRQRGDRAEERVAGLERRLDDLDGAVSSLGPLAEHPARIAALEARIESLAGELSRHMSSVQERLSARGEESAETERRLTALSALANDLTARIDGAARAAAEAADAAARNAAASNAAVTAAAAASAASSGATAERLSGLESRLEDAQRAVGEAQGSASAAAEAMQALEARLLERIAKTEGRSRATAEALRRALEALEG